MVNFHKFNYSKEHFNLIKSIDDIAQSDLGRNGEALK